MIKAKLGVHEVIPELVRHRQRKQDPGRNAASTANMAGTAFAVPPDGNSREFILPTAKAAEVRGLNPSHACFGC
jgi:hypothetical protein